MDGISGWSQQIHYSASDGAAYDYFGNSISVYKNLVVVGSYYDDTFSGANAGSAYLFDTSDILPSANPTSAPSNTPTTSVPSVTPTAEPSPEPSSEPSAMPSNTPTTSVPSATPATQFPTDTPTTLVPSKTPSSSEPTAEPSSVPSTLPSAVPSCFPTVRGDTNPPSISPSSKPSSFVPTSAKPSAEPSAVPSSAQPTFVPTDIFGLYISFGVIIKLDGVDCVNLESNTISIDVAKVTTRDGLDPLILLNEIIFNPSGCSNQSTIRIETSWSVNSNINNLGYSDSQIAFNTMKNNLTVFMSSGLYSSALISYGNENGVATFSNVTITQPPIFSDYQEYSVYAPNNNKRPMTKLMLLIGIPLLLFGVLVIGCIIKIVKGGLVQNISKMENSWRSQSSFWNDSDESSSNSGLDTNNIDIELQDSSNTKKRKNSNASEISLESSSSNSMIQSVIVNQTFKDQSSSANSSSVLSEDQNSVSRYSEDLNSDLGEYSSAASTTVGSNQNTTASGDKYSGGSSKSNLSNSETSSNSILSGFVNWSFHGVTKNPDLTTVAADVQVVSPLHIVPNIQQVQESSFNSGSFDTV